MPKRKYKYRDLSRYGIDKALELLDDGQQMLWHDHEMTMNFEYLSRGLDEPTMVTHQREEPGCSYCAWITKARELLGR